MLFRVQPAWFTAGLAAIAVILTAAFSSAGIPGRIKEQYGVHVPEAGWSYGRSSFTDFLAGVGWDGLEWYRRALWWDLLFAIAVGALFVREADHNFGAALQRSEGHIHDAACRDRSRQELLVDIVIWFFIRPTKVNSRSLKSLSSLDVSFEAES